MNRDELKGRTSQTPDRSFADPMYKYEYLAALHQHGPSQHRMLDLCGNAGGIVGSLLPQ